MTIAHQQSVIGRGGWLLLALYFSSGVIALSYEVLWVKMLSIQFGISNHSVVVTVTAFMLGLGLGSLYGVRLVNKFRQPLYLFITAELLIAVLALILPLLIEQITTWHYEVASETAVEYWFGSYSLIFFVVLAMPAFLMGAAFPAVIKVAEKHQVRLPYLYGANIVGGASGAMVSLLLLGLYGWQLSMYLVAFAGALVALFSLRLIGEQGQAEMKFSRVGKTDYGLLISYALIGLAALVIQVVWVRLYGMLMLRTEYVVAMILCSVLLGMGLGSLLSRRVANHYWQWWLPLVVCFTVIAGAWLLAPLSGWIESVRFGSIQAALIQQWLLLMLVTLPVTAAFGAWLPLLAQQHKEKNVAPLLYGVNSLGAAVGAVLAGFLLIPSIGSMMTLYVAVFIVWLSGYVWVKDKRYLITLLPLIVLIYPVAQFPDAAELKPTTLADVKELFRYEDAISVTHVVEDGDGQRLLLSDLQRMDASTEPSAIAAQQNQARLPLMLHPNPEHVLFLGMGTGITASVSLAYENMQREAVELSKGAIEAATKWFDRANGEIVEQMHVVHDDARRYLMRKDRQYDVIIGDLFHPDLVGRSALLSIQQFQRVRQRLSEDGLYVQWLALNQFDRYALDVVVRTFVHAFPESVMFVEGFRLALVGFNGTWSGAEVLHQNLAMLNEVQRKTVLGGETVETWLGRYWGRIAMSEGAIQDEWRPVIEFSLPSIRYSAGDELALLLAQLLQQRPAVDQAVEELVVGQQGVEPFRRSFIATELAFRSWQARLQGSDQESRNLMGLAFQANPDDRWIAFAMADSLYANREQLAQQGVSIEKSLESVLKVRPDHIQALQALAVIREREGRYDEVAALREKITAISPYGMSH